MRDFLTAVVALATCPLGMATIVVGLLVLAVRHLLAVGRWVDRRAAARVERMVADFEAADRLSHAEFVEHVQTVRQRLAEREASRTHISEEPA